jgi:hypothetical protein
MQFKQEYKMDLRNIPISEKKVNKPLIKREIPIVVSYTDPEGVDHQDTIISKVPDGDGKLMIDRKMAVLAGSNWDLLSPLSRLRIEAMAVLSVQIVNIPDWLNQWSVCDDDLLFQVREVLGRHTSLYFRADIGAGEGNEAGQRLAIYSSDLD